MPTPSRRLLSGWGRSQFSRAEWVRPGSGAELEQLLQERWSGPDSVIGRGLGRSYGDAAQSGGGLVVDCTGLDQILDFDRSRGILRVGAGASLESVLRLVIPAGYFIPVTPGTRHVTIGGAIAADIHGKNHHRDGSFMGSVSEIVLHAPTGRFQLHPHDGPLFDATFGGMGLTGILEEATIQLKSIETASMAVDTRCTVDLDECLELMTSGDAGALYSVAWIDCLARGRHLGRAVLTHAEHATVDELPGKLSSQPLDYAPTTRVSVPMIPPRRLIHRPTMAAFNHAYFSRARHSPAHQIQSITAFFHPLDVLGHWNYLYGPRGFTQYQFVVPFGAEATLRGILEHISSSRSPAFLAVLKRFGPASSGHLSFPMSGWTLAVDFALGGSGTGPMLDAFDDQVADSGGRVYLAKDGRLRPELMMRMYPRLDAWREVRARVDPHGKLTSDLARRVGIDR